MYNLITTLSACIIPPINLSISQFINEYKNNKTAHNQSHYIQQTFTGVSGRNISSNCKEGVKGAYSYLAGFWVEHVSEAKLYG